MGTRLARFSALFPVGCFEFLAKFFEILLTDDLAHFGKDFGLPSISSAWWKTISRYLGASLTRLAKPLPSNMMSLVGLQADGS
jgi:hypothetical protein